MPTKLDPEEGEYSYINDGFFNTDTPNYASHYQHLRKQGNTKSKYSERPKGRHGEHLQREKSRARRDGQKCCKKPPWWVWLLVVIGLVIIGGIAAVLLFMFQIFPKQNDQATTADPAQFETDPTTSATQSTTTTHTTSTTPTTTVPSTPPNIPTPKDCQALYNADQTRSGVYTISPDGGSKMDVYCEQDMYGGGWTVFQQRLNGRVSFDRGWNDYKFGFGDPSGDFWLGNDDIHILTDGRGQKLRIEMSYPITNVVYVDYKEFWTADATNKYQLHISGFSTPYGHIIDHFAYHNGAKFSTKDQDNDRHTVHCADINYGGWWYATCHYVNLNGKFNGTGQYTSIRWRDFIPYGVSLSTVRMMVKTA